MLKLEIDTDNNAFAEDCQGEVVRLLRKVASRIERGELACAIRDINGNVCGMFTLALPEEESDADY